MIDPNKNEDLLALDSILKTAGANLVAVESVRYKGEFPIAYIFNLGIDFRMASALRDTAEACVVPNGGQILGQVGPGFTAKFDSEQAQLDFLRAFSKAASALYPPKEQITTKPNGFVLGGDNEMAYSQFGF